MRKLLLLFGFSFLFSHLSSAQQHNQVTMILTEYYTIPNSNDLDLDRLFYSGKNMEEFEYDDRNNLFFHQEISYDSLDEITGWNGYDYTYNENDQILEIAKKRYNWEVDLWVNQFWTNYKYDNLACNYEIIQQPNTQQSIPLKWIYTNNEDCQPIAAQLIYDFNKDGFFDLDTELRYDIIYDYHENGERSYQYWKSYSYSAADLTLVANYEAFLFYNTYGDITERTVYDLDNGPEIHTHRIVNFEFSFDEKDRLIKKREFKEEHIGENATLTTKQFRVFNYGYTCDGLLLHEEVVTYSDELFETPTEIIRKHLTYKDQHPCVDYQDQLKPRITPNPASQMIEIRMPIFQGQETAIRIYALSGKLIKQALVPANQIKYQLNITDFPNGIYVVLVKSGDRFSNEKLVVAR